VFFFSTSQQQNFVHQIAKEKVAPEAQYQAKELYTTAAAAEAAYGKILTSFGMDGAEHRSTTIHRCSRESRALCCCVLRNLKQQV